MKRLMKNLFTMIIMTKLNLRGNLMQKHTALVTGGTGAIGTAICQALYRQGVRVIASYHSGSHPDAGKSWQAKQQQAGYTIATHAVDVTDFDSCTALLAVAEQQGPIDILVNNAGVTSDAPCYKMDIQAWHKVINTNLNSAFNMTRQVINGMIDRRYGRIINISSINGQKGQFGQVNYAASKAGMHGFTKALALEVARKGITVNTISPGYIETEMVMAVPEPIREKIIDQIPMGRLGQPEEIARAVVFLASQESSFITGVNLAINGGHYMS